MAFYPKSVAYTRAFLMIASSDHVSALTGATCTVNLSKAGAAFGAAGGTVTEIANGWYKVALNTTDTGTAGDLAFHITATSGDPTDFVDQVYDPATANLGVNTVNLGGTAQTGRDIGASVLLATGQKVDVDTIKTNPVVNAGTVTFPTGATLASTTNITAATGIDVTKWSGTTVTTPDTAGSPKVTITPGSGTGQLDVTSGVIKANLAQILGTALTETAGQLAGGFKKFFNIGSPAATMDHGVLVDTVTTATNLTTNNDKTGYTASTVSDKTGYALTAAYDAAKTASQAGDVMKVSSGTGANQINLASGVADVNLKQINGTTVNGDGSGTPWGP